MMRRFAISFLMLMAAVTGVGGQSSMSITTVSTVAAVTNTPGSYTTITGQNWGTMPPAYIYAEGYYNPGA
jgi:hypothetical protein